MRSGSRGQAWHVREISERLLPPSAARWVVWSRRSIFFERQVWSAPAAPQAADKSELVYVQQSRSALQWLQVSPAAERHCTCEPSNRAGANLCDGRFAAGSHQMTTSGVLADSVGRGG